MEEVKYIPVKEFAERAGIARQNIYKAYSNPKSKIYPYVQVKPKGIFISTQALTDLYTPDNTEQTPADTEKQEQTPAQETPDTAPIVKTDNEQTPADTSEQPPADTGKQPEQPPIAPTESQLYTDYIRHLEAEIQRLTEEKTVLQQANQKQQEQIMDLSNRVIEVSNQALSALKQEQHLTYLDKAPDRPEAPAPKRSLLKRLFGND